MASSFLFNCCTVIKETKLFFFSACLTDLRPHRFLNLSRKDQNLLSPVNCWYLLLNQVRRESKDHATLSDIYLNNVIMRFMQISEDSTRLLKKVSMGNTDTVWMAQFISYLLNHLHSSVHSFIHILLGLYVLLCLFVSLSSELNILFSCSTDVCAQPEEVKCDQSLINKNRGLNSPLTQTKFFSVVKRGSSVSSHSFYLNKLSTSMNPVHLTITYLFSSLGYIFNSGSLVV